MTQHRQTCIRDDKELEVSNGGKKFNNIKIVTVTDVILTSKQNQEIEGKSH